MSLTLPQIIMLNHAAWVEKENCDRRIEADRNDKDNFADSKVTINGKEFTAKEVKDNDDLREGQMDGFISALGRM